MRAAFNVAQSNAAMWLCCAALWLVSPSVDARAEATVLCAAMCAANAAAAVWAARRER